MIPLVLLAGFLGAGKTRLLSELIPQLGARGARVRVILNDFENASIDAARLGALNALVTPLNGECICCGSLRELLQTLYDVPPDAGSVMLIEANGATETDELLGHLTADRRLAHYTLPLQVTVVDAGRWQKRWWHNALERAQVTTATHLVLNWTARVSPVRQSAVTGALKDINARAELVDAETFARWLHELALQVQHDEARGGRASIAPQAGSATRLTHTKHVAPHDHPFGSATMPLPVHVDRTRFAEFVQRLPQAVVRAKGLVRFADEPGMMYVWHRVPGRKGVRLDKSLPHADAEPTALFIGVHLPLSELAEQLTALQAPL